MKIKKRNNIAIKNNNTMHKSPQSVKKSERTMTPDGRAIPRKGKKKIKARDFLNGQKIFHIGDIIQ